MEVMHDVERILQNDETPTVQIEELNKLLMKVTIKIAPPKQVSILVQKPRVDLQVVSHLCLG